MTLLKELSDAFGPSGKEQAVKTIIRKHMKSCVTKIYEDKFGNLIAYKKGTGPKILLAAHMDEVGFMVKHIAEDGKIIVEKIGGIEASTVVGQKVKILSKSGKKYFKGTLSSVDIQEHMKPVRSPNIGNVYIDMGMKKKEIEKLDIAIGCFVVPDTHFEYFDKKKDIACGKALDNRIGCYMLLELAKRLKGKKTPSIYYVFTVQEEIGLIGMTTSLYDIDPDWGIAVDTTASQDALSPKVIEAGKGPVITIKDAGMIANECLNDWIEKLAQKNNIPLQKEVDAGGTTDATRIMLAKGGIPSTVLGVAIRNIHSGISIAHMQDAEHGITLLYHLMKNPVIKCIV